MTSQNLSIKTIPQIFVPRASAKNSLWTALEKNFQKDVCSYLNLKFQISFTLPWTYLKKVLLDIDYQNQFI